MPQWRQGLTKSLHQTRSMPESRYFQLATVDGSGVPYCRTVVFRGITDDNQLVIISDTRSLFSVLFIERGTRSQLTEVE